jgi:hypothetical protein
VRLADGAAQIVKRFLRIAEPFVLFLEYEAQMSA